MMASKKWRVVMLICGFCVGAVLFERYMFKSESTQEWWKPERKNNTDKGLISETTDHARNMITFLLEPSNVSQSKASTDSLPNSGPKPSDIVLPRNKRYMAYLVTDDVKPSVQRKLIAMFNRPVWLLDYDRLYQRVFDTCPYKCNMTDDRSLLPKADAVVVDFCGLQNRIPPQHPPHQMWVAHYMEAPFLCSGYHGFPAWKSVFNRTFGYRTDSDFFCPYGGFEVLTAPIRKNYTDIMLKKTKAVAWFVSNCETRSGRQQYVKEMKKYIEIDVYGRCGTLKCVRLANENCLRLLNSTYYFYLSFENCFCEDYMTEKVFKTYWNMNVIPVVRGGANYSLYLPPGTYLDAANFTSPKHLADYLLALMNDVDAYTAMLRTKDHFYASYGRWEQSNHRPFCEMCKMLQMSHPPTRHYPDILEWGTRNKCWSPRDL